MLRAGTLNRLVRIEQQGVGQTAAGQPVKTPWTLLAQVWANVRYVNGKTYVAADRETAAATVSVRVRYRGDLVAGMRVVHGYRPLTILAVLPDEERREYVDLACSVGERL